jgi:Tol biopolymer transport system component
LRTARVFQAMSRPLVLLLCGLLAGCGGEPAADPPAPNSPTAEPSPSSSVSAGLAGEIAYVAGQDPQIHILDLATGESRQLTNLGAEHAELTSSGPLRPVISCGLGVTTLSWSPDGTLLAFAYGGCDAVVYVVDLKGALTRIADGRAPAWSADGSRLAFAPNVPFCMAPGACGQPPRPGAWNLQVADVAEGLRPEPLSMDEATAFGSQPHYSPDGATVAYSGQFEEGADAEVFSASFVIDAGGTDPRRVASGAWSAGWMPDGRLLIVDELTSDLHALDLNTGESQELGGDVGAAPVSPDGSRLLLTATDVAGTTGVAMLTIDGDLIAEWAGYPATWAPDSRAAVIVDPDAPSLVVIDRDGNELLTFELSAPADAFSTAAWRPGT